MGCVRRRSAVTPPRLYESLLQSVLMGCMRMSAPTHAVWCVLGRKPVAATVAHDMYVMSVCVAAGSATAHAVSRAAAAHASVICTVCVVCVCVLIRTTVPAYVCVHKGDMYARIARKKTRRGGKSCVFQRTLPCDQKYNMRK